jgi:threonylcarbamoyladenosine tRNA methylthiotransferase MtaB
MKKVAIQTLGCRSNQLESSIIADKFARLGWQVVDFGESADIYVINTCTVTSKSDRTSRSLIRKAKNINPDSKIVVTGCYSQTSPEEVAQIEQVDLVIGNVEKANLVDSIVKENLLEKKHRKIYVSDIMNQEMPAQDIVLSASGRTRANIKIQDGCNHRCSYCIIPYARGKSRSVDQNIIINQIKELTKRDFNEVVLSGIHLGQWGLDLSCESFLSDLLNQIETIKSLKRYRLSSIDPMEFTPELVSVLTNSEKFCRHLHISLQSGNNQILKLMKRRYTVEYYTELIETLAQKIPFINIGSDIIVGFPGETEGHFEDTLENLKKLSIGYIHVFTYSKRKNTPAALMSNQVNEELKKQRNLRLKTLASLKNLEFRKKMIGNTFEIAVELSRDKKTGFLKGMTDNFVSVLADGPDDFMNKVLKVNILCVDKENTIGKFF